MIFIEQKFQEFLRLYDTFSKQEQEKIQLFLDLRNRDDIDNKKFYKEIREKRFSNKRVCPHCGSISIKKWGYADKQKEKQRYMCNDCETTFTDTTASPLDHTKSSLRKWGDFIKCMIRGLSLRKTAEYVGIHYTTAFHWRHKILDSLDVLLNDTNLKGTVQVDETFVLESCKGNHKHNQNFQFPNGRKARKRGGKAKKRGLSKDQVCIACGIDQRNHLVMTVSNYGHISSDTIEKVYDKKINEVSILCSDGLKEYKIFAQNHNFEHYVIPSGKYKNGIYHINNVNSLHSRFKSWLEHFKGVSTKHLQNYVTWFKWLEKYKDLSHTDKIKEFLVHSNCVFKGTKYNQVSRRSNKVLVQ